MFEYNILIIDDSEQDKKIIKTVLSKNGFNNLSFSSTGEEGLEKFKNETFDVVFIDTILPQMNGFEVCQYIRNLSTSRTKIIIMTGQVDAVDVAKARRSGAD